MIEPTSAATAATTPAKTPAGASGVASPKGTTSFAGELAKFVSKSAATPVKAAARPEGEQTKKVAGHPYSKISSGPDKGMFLNQLTGSPRMGSAFNVVERDDRVFHSYGTGRDKVVVEIKKPGASDAAASKTGGATPSTT